MIDLATPRRQYQQHSRRRYAATTSSNGPQRTSISVSTSKFISATSSASCCLRSSTIWVLSVAWGGKAGAIAPIAISPPAEEGGTTLSKLSLPHATSAMPQATSAISRFKSRLMVVITNTRWNLDFCESGS